MRDLLTRFADVLAFSSGAFAVSGGRVGTTVLHEALRGGVPTRTQTPLPLPGSPNQGPGGTGSVTIPLPAQQAPPPALPPAQAPAKTPPASMRTTAEIYAHAMRGKDDDAAKVRDAIQERARADKSKGVN